MGRGGAKPVEFDGFTTVAMTQGVTYRSAWEWFKNGALPVPARQLSTGTILVDRVPWVPRFR